MANKIQIRRGLKADMPVLAAGEPAFPTDTREFYIGTGSGNVNMGGSHWYRGTAMSGTSTTANAYSYAACPEVKLDDIYMNTSNGNIYACTTAGKGTAAKWTYQGCIKGATGATGSYAAVDSALSSTSTNPVQNKAVTEALSDKLDYAFDSNGYLNINELTLDLIDMKNEHLAPPTTITIASVDSKHQWLANYICTGSNDTTVFQNAINALSSGGGKIAVLEGTYTISSALTCNENVIIEGMGNGTVINCTNHAFLNNTTAGCRIVLKNMAINLTGALDETYGFINSVSDLLIDNCKISAITTSYNYASTTDASKDGTLDYIHCTGGITIIDSNILVDVQTYNAECSAFIGQEENETINNIKVNGCNVELYNCYHGGSTSSTDRQRIDLYFLRANGVISNCHFICRGNRANNSYAISNIAQWADIIGCYIDAQNDYASIHSESSCYAMWNGTGKFISNEVLLNTSYISSDIVIGNKFIKSGSDYLHFEGRQPTVVGNKFINGKTNDIVASSTAIIFTNNWLKYDCTVNSGSTSLVDNNKVSSLLK